VTKVCKGLFLICPEVENIPERSKDQLHHGESEASKSVPCVAPTLQP